MAYLKFDTAKMERLDDPGRLAELPPAVMWTALGDPEPRLIVDIGAGTGLFASAFAGLAPDSVVYAADVEQVMIEWMIEHRPEAASGTLVPLLAQETRVPLDDGAADLVVMIDVHHHLADPAASYLDAYRLLRPGGQVLLVDWKRAETPKGPPLAVRATRDELVGSLLTAGFERVTAHDGLAWHEMLTAERR